MLRSASELGFTPSTLTIVRIFQSMPEEAFQEASKRQLFLAADARFKDMIAEGVDPDALTLQGIILAKKGDAKKALVAFRRAATAWEVNGKRESTDVADRFRDASEAEVAAEQQQEYVLPAPRDPRWEWEVSCVLGQADILRRQGAVGEAEELYRVAALELDHPRAFLELAMVMGGPCDSPERRTYLLKAAISGEPEACRELGKLEKMATSQKALSRKERAERDLISKEWFRLVDGESLLTIKADAFGGSEET